jgi:plasmid stability protein
LPQYFSLSLLIRSASKAIIASMADLNIRNVPESVRRGLRLRAARKGRSMEAEAGTILADAVRGETGKPFDPASLQDFISALFKGKPPRLTDELIRERRHEARKEDRQ